MTRRRNKENKGLPERWRWKGGAYRYLVPKGQEHLWDDKTEFKLGETLPKAYEVYAGRLASTEGAIQTFNQLIDRYLVEVTPTKAQSTQRGEREHLAKIRSAIGHWLVSDFRIGDAFALKSKLKQKSSRASGETYVNRVMEKVSAICKQAIEWGVIEEHPMYGKFTYFKTPQKSSISKAQSIEQVVDALPYTVPWMQNYVKLKLLTGLRQTDMLLLTQHCISEEGLLVTHSKTEGSSGQSTLYEWSPELRKVIDDIKAIPPTSIYLFKTQRGTPLLKNKTTNSAFNSAWRRWMTQLEKHTDIPKFSEKSIRNLVGSEGNLQEAADRLGHASTATTKRYYRNKPTRVKTLSSNKS
jgi:integrase